jgi:hypothetical protein
MADRYIPEHRRTQFKAKHQFKPDELRRRREEQRTSPSDEASRPAMVESVLELAKSPPLTVMKKREALSRARYVSSSFPLYTTSIFALLYLKAYIMFNTGNIFPIVFITRIQLSTLSEPRS